MMKQFFTIIFPALLALTAVMPIRPAQGNEECDCFPHADDWKKVENHGLTAFDRYKNGLDATIGETCQECHGTDLTGGYTGVSCYSCHAAFPHDEGWKEPTSHGVYAFNNGWEENCQNACHGEDYSGGYAEVACGDCHKPFPHDKEWADTDKTESADFHGNYVLENVPMKLSQLDRVEADNTCRSQCHGTTYEGGLSNKACADCHEAYPHAVNWSRPDAHGVYSATFGVAENCGIGCHGKEYEGGNTEISCYDCHENFPHEADFDEGHQSMAEDDVWQCATLCHGSDLSGGLSGVGCTSCHDNILWPLYQPISRSIPRLLPF